MRISIHSWPRHSIPLVTNNSISKNPASCFYKRGSDKINNKIIALLTFLITLLSLIAGCIQQEKNTFYVGSGDADYNTIQQAINAAKNGATIIIKNGSYNELLVINKTITLIGEDKNTTILNFSPNYDIRSQLAIITINAANCSIENLQITLSNRSRFLDVEIQSGGCCGEPDVVKTTSLIAGGISINSSYNTIKNNIITNVSKGIELLASTESNTLKFNEIKNNEIGIETLRSINNTISHNIVSNNQQYNIYVSTDSDTNKVSFNSMDTSIYGIRIKDSDDNIVYNNCIKNNDIGIYCCCDAKSNTIYSNTFLNNSVRNAEESAGLLNIWYVYPNGTGNYWDDYNGSDANLDGICDIPYTITVSKNQDLHPLMTPPVDIPCN